MAHRIAWSRVFGPIPDGLVVCHRCDNPPCVRPDHLFLGTHQDNDADRDAKGRTANGERIGAAKLTDEQVAEIRRLRDAGLSQTSIAARYGVSQSHVSRIVNFQNRAMPTRRKESLK
jgi:hypothetical protein